MLLASHILFLCCALLLLAYQAPYHWLLARIVQMVYTRQAPGIRRDRGRSFVILVPAHNEEDGLPATLDSLRCLSYPKSLYEIIVIADNCQDRTAEVARARDVTVLERSDAQKKSKGYALEFALQHLQQRAAKPAAVVVIDADTRVDASLLEIFAGELASGKDWIQAYYSVSNPDESQKTKLMTYAFSLFNGIWLLGQDFLGLGSALRGNGMCFSWAGLQRCPWQAYGLAEDLEFSWRLRLAGEKVHFTAAARVYGEMIAGQAQAAASQRQRWEHGRKGLEATFGQELRESSFAGERLFLLKTDLKMPPLSRYVSVLGLSLVLLLLARKTMTAGFHGPLISLVGITLLTVLFLYLFSPFYCLGLPLRYGLSLLRAPFYMLWKLRLAFRPAPSAWARATRKNDSPGKSASK